MKIFRFGAMIFSIFMLLLLKEGSEIEASNYWVDQIKDKKMLRFDYNKISNMLKDAKNKLPNELKQKEHKFFVSDDQNLALEGFSKIHSIDDIDPGLIKDSAFLVFFHTDEDYFYTLKKIKDNKGKFLSLWSTFPKTRYIWVDKYAMLAVDKTFSFGNKVSHLTLDIHETICLCLNITKNLPGDYVEIGVYKGGSALTTLHYMSYSGIKRKAYFFDTFDGMTYQEAHDSSDVVWDNTHVLWGVEQTMQYVGGLLKTTGQDFELIQSNICRDELPSEINQIAVCNVDVDIYEATLDALIKVAPLMVKGGIIIAEDPTSTPALGGALVAMEEFLMTPIGKKFMKILHKAQYLLIKIDD